MIYTLKEQITMIFLFIIMGIFISMVLDTIHTLLSKINIINYIVQIILWCIMTIICIKLINRISDGYFPLYTIMFFVIGYVVYYKLFSKQYIKILLKIKKCKKVILLALFPITLYNYIVRNIKKHTKEKEKDNEKDTINNNSIIDDNIPSSVH